MFCCEKVKRVGINWMSVEWCALFLRFNEEDDRMELGVVTKQPSDPNSLKVSLWSQFFIMFFIIGRSPNWWFRMLFAGAVDGWLRWPTKLTFDLGIESFKLLSIRFFKFPTGCDISLLLSLILRQVALIKCVYFLSWFTPTNGSRQEIHIPSFDEWQRSFRFYLCSVFVVVFCLSTLDEATITCKYMMVWMN